MAARDYAPPRPFFYLLAGATLLVAVYFTGLPRPDAYFSPANDSAPGESLDSQDPSSVQVTPKRQERFVLKQENTSGGEGRRQMFIWVGLAALVIGSVELRMHGNRYCLECGAKFRQARGGGGGFFRRELGVDDSAHSASRHGAGKISKNTPVEPLLKCLRVKSASMRREAAETLRKVTGQEFGEDADAWDKWWAEQKNTKGGKS